MLGLLEFFWDWDGAPPAPATSDDDTGRSNAGGGGYNAHDDEYWDAREAVLRAQFPDPNSPNHAWLTEAHPKRTVPLKNSEEGKARLAEMVRQIVAEQNELTFLKQERTQNLSRMHSAASIDDLKGVALYSKQLEGSIRTLEATTKARIAAAHTLRTEILRLEGSN